MEENKNNLEKTTYLEFSDVEKKRSGLLTAIIILVILAVIGVLGYFGYNQFFKKSPKELYASNIETAIKKVNNSLDTFAKFYQNELKGSVKLEGLLFSMSGIDVINDYEFTIGNKIDENNKIALTNFAIEDTKTKNKLDANIYLKDGDIYLDLKDTYNGIIKLTSEMDEETKKMLQNAISDLGNNNYVKFSYLLDKVTKLYLSTLENEDFKQENAKLSVNGKEQSLTATSIRYDDEKAYKMVKTIIEGLLEDEVSISYISNISNTTIEDVKKELNDILNEDLKEKSDEILDVIIYTKGSTFAGYKISINEQMMSFINVDKDIEFNLNDTFKIIGNYDKGGKITVSTFNGKDSIDIINLIVNEYTDKNVDIDFKLSDKLFNQDNSSSMKTSISGNIKNSKSSNDTNINEKIIIALNVDLQGMSSKVTLTLDETASNKQANIDVDLSEAKELNDSISKDIEEKLNKKIQSFSIYKSLEESIKNNLIIEQ